MTRPPARIPADAFARTLRRAAATLTAAVLAAGVVPLAAAPATAVPPAVQAAARAVTAPPAVVTLITGDRVRVITRADGRQDVALLGDGSGRPTRAQVRRSGGRVEVVPTSAAVLLREGVLDRRLFDVTRLVADGHAGRPLPLLLTGAGALGARAAGGGSSTPPAPPAGSTVTRRIAELGVTAVVVKEAGASAFWDALVTTAPPAAARGTARTPAEPPATGLAGGVAKVWLNGRVRATLDRSVAQIGGPAARKKGLDGRGVKVAVLDTGIDDQHPDVAGRQVLQADFSGEGGTDDANGHGTHVASTVAGGGERSGGKFAGVAPRASLLDGKVLDAGGSGSEEGVLAGMQWAAASGADIVNMSLGGGPTDGTDPLALAVDQLTERHGSLFVIAAGNSYEENTIDSPGSATSALTVGAVDRNDAVADFSSKGPRLDGSLIKPEITAPGVDIVAAQADGTELGDVAAPGYIALSGTSMATPHVAGSAALLLQQHTDWTAAQLKAGLVSRAKRTAKTTVWHQGAGRVDLAAATTTGVRVDAGTLDLGYFQWPHGGDATVRKTLTYTNDTTASRKVVLSYGLANDAGAKVPAKAVTISPSTFTLAAGASKRVTVTLRPDAAGVGRWGGAINARTSAGSSRTATAFIKETERYDIGFRALDRAGKESPAASFEVLDLGTGEVTFIDGAGTKRLAPGRYSMAAWAYDPGTGEAVLVSRPQVTITKAARLTFDARPAVEYRTTVPAADTVVQVQSLGYERGTDDASLSSSFSTFGGGATLWATPTGTVTRGSFSVFTNSERRVAEIRARVAGDPTALDPALLRYDASLDGRRDVELVGSPAAATGRFLLVRVSGDQPADAAVQAAKDAGATGVVLAHTDPAGFAYLERRSPLPGLVLPAEEGAALADRTAAGPVTLELDGAFHPAANYLLAANSPGRSPASLSFTYAEADLARVQHTFTDHGAGGEGLTFSFPDLPSGFASGVPSRLGGTRTDWLTPGTWGDTFEAFQVTRTEDDFEYEEPLAAWEGDDVARRAGVTGREVWGGQVARPAAPRAAGVFPARYGDDVFGWLSPWTDRSRHVAYQLRDDKISWTLESGGRTVAKGEDAALETRLPARAGNYRLTLKAERPSAGGLKLSTGSTTVWRFSSARPPAATDGAPLALISLDTSMGLDRSNSVARNSTVPVTVSARMPAGRRAVQLTRLALETSADGGRTWTRATMNRTDGNTFTGSIRTPDAAGPVALRIAATAGSVTSVNQTVTAAFAVR